MNPAPLVKGLMRKRADIVLVERGFFSSRARAQAAIAAGLVSVGGVALKKASEEIAGDAPIEAEAPHPWASRGGSQACRGARRLRARSCTASSASTSAPRPEASPTSSLRAAPRRSSPSMSATDSSIRASRRTRVSVRLNASTHAALTAEMLGERAGAIVVDVSFISQRLLLPHVLKLAAKRAWLVSLIKPQFELDRADLVKGPGHERSGARARMRWRARHDRSARLDGARPHALADPRRRRGAGIPDRRAP